MFSFSKECCVVKEYQTESWYLVSILILPPNTLSSFKMSFKKNSPQDLDSRVNCYETKLMGDIKKICLSPSDPQPSFLDYN